MVKAVSGWDFSSSLICQNPEVRSRVERVGPTDVTDAFGDLLHGVLVDVGVLVELPEVLHDP